MKLRAKSALQPTLSDPRCAYGKSKKDIKGLVEEAIFENTLRWFYLNKMVVLNYSGDDRSFSFVSHLNVFMHSRKSQTC